MRPKGSAKRRRQRAIALLEQDHAPVDVARMVGVDRRSVCRWKAAYRQQGAKGIKARTTPGRPRKLDPRQRTRLERLLLKGARAVGYETVGVLLARPYHVPRQEGARSDLDALAGDLD